MKCWAQAMFGTPCDAPMQRAHLGFRKSKLKQEMRKRGETWDIWDPRIWRYVCWGHHQLLDGPNFHLWMHQLPSSVLDYADEHGIRDVLENADVRRKQTDNTSPPIRIHGPPADG